MTHTPEPWRTIKDHKGADYGVQMGAAGGFALHRDANAEANAHRIVACVNACAGISNENLEAIAEIGGFDGTQEAFIRVVACLKKAEQQRDEYKAELAEVYMSTLKTTGKVVVMRKERDELREAAKNYLELQGKAGELAALERLEAAIAKGVSDDI